MLANREHRTMKDLEILRPGMETQLARRRDAIAKGMTPRGWKIGLNVAAVQASFGLTGPCVGWLDGRRVLASGAFIDFLPEVKMRVEPEVCLRVGAGGRLEAIAPALEIVDFTVPPKDLFELLAGSILHVATVVGEFVSPDRGVDLGTRWPRLEVTGQPSPPLGRDLVASDLQSAVDFVGQALAGFGEKLAQGDLIIAGSYAGAVPPLERGARAEADFGPLGSVSVTRRA
jgi:2-keto-4-pentenoate hydratase